MGSPSGFGRSGLLIFLVFCYVCILRVRTVSRVPNVASVWSTYSIALSIFSDVCDYIIRWNYELNVDP
jgi:hypothetical protein